MAEEFEPRIVAFLCKWCSSAGSDLAGVSRMEYPPNVVPIQVMCSGSVSPLYIFSAFNKGVDGVLVSGCHPGDCHYKEGNYKAARRMSLLGDMLVQFGIERERFRLEWISASEGEKFANVANEMTEAVRKLGPLDLKIGAVPGAAVGGAE